MPIPIDREQVKQVKPWLRSLAAFLLYLRDPMRFTVAGAYHKADEFLEQLDKDV